MPNAKQTYEEYLNRRGFEKKPMPRNPDRTRWQVRTLASNEPDLVAVVSVANHLTCIRHGVIEDIWDCGNKYVGNYYVAPRS